MAISAVEIINSWGNSPAKVHRPTGKMYINRKYIGRLSADQWAFIIAHEAGHIAENTRNEFRADELASAKYFEQKRSPKNSIKALAEVLDFSHPSHQQRLIKQFYRAAQHDCAVNNHKKSCDMINDLKEIDYEIIPLPTGVSIANFDSGDYAEFTSIVDKCDGKKGKDFKQCKKAVKKDNKAERKETRTNAKAESRTILAEQGIDVSANKLNAIGGIVKGVGAAAAGIGGAALGIGAGAGLAKGLPKLIGGGGAAAGNASGGNGILSGAKNLLGGGVQSLGGGGGNIANSMLPGTNTNANNLALPGGFQNLEPLTKNITPEAKEKNSNNLLIIGGITLFVIAALFLLKQ